MARPDLPSGTVTFLFTDIEGSTRLLHEIGPAGYAEALAAHRQQLREAFAGHGGVEVDTEGDAFFVAFANPMEAVAAVSEAQAALADGPIRVRMGLHTGTPHLTGHGYVGEDVHLGARICASAHGGQLVLSKQTRAAVDEQTELLDLGEHRLKDFDEPVWLYQLGTERFPPLRTISNTNLPHPASSFVGRAREVAEIGALLTGSARLVTLTGPGGTGKTRLAIDAAAELVPSFRNGVFWIPLAALRDPALVPETIAQTVGAKDGLADHIGEREMLLVVDNLEQVVGAAPDLSSLIEVCPNLRLLVTSRERLRVRGETEYAVPPLSDVEAVELFCERSNLRADETILELCRRLDDLPLAVELAAARTSLLTPSQILERLSRRLDLLRGGRDTEARQATLRATIEWSHELLTPDEQALFARLSVFRGGFTIDGAESVCDADLEVLSSLVDKSLVRKTDGRLTMLETIREFAKERLAASRDQDVYRRRHLNHFVSMAEGWYEQRFASEPALLRVIDAEADNVRAAIDWAQAHDPSQAARLAGAVAGLWSLSGRTTEAKLWIAAALEQHAERDAVWARAMSARGELLDDPHALKQALQLWRQLGDRESEAASLEALGWAYDTLGDHLAARASHEESLAVRAHTGSPEVRGLSARAGLCHVLVARSETAAAGVVAQELLVLSRKHDAVLMQELALHFLADCSLVDGDWAEAEIRYRRALAFAQAAGLIGRVIDETVGVAMALAGAGDSARALRLAAAAHQKGTELGREDDAWWERMQDRLLGRARLKLGDAEATSAEDMGRTAGLDAVVPELLAEEHTDVQA